MSKATAANTEPEKKTEQAAVIDTNVIILKKTRVGNSIFLPKARISVTKALAEKLEADGKATIVY